MSKRLDCSQTLSCNVCQENIRNRANITSRPLIKLRVTLYWTGKGCKTPAWISPRVSVQSAQIWGRAARQGQNLKTFRVTLSRYSSISIVKLANGSRLYLRICCQQRYSCSPLLRGGVSGVSSSTSCFTPWASRLDNSVDGRDISWTRTFSSFSLL